MIRTITDLIEPADLLDIMKKSFVKNLFRKPVVNESLQKQLQQRFQARFKAQELDYTAHKCRSLMRDYALLWRSSTAKERGEYLRAAIDIRNSALSFEAKARGYWKEAKAE